MNCCPVQAPTHLGHPAHPTRLATLAKPGGLVTAATLVVSVVGLWAAPGARAADGPPPDAGSLLRELPPPPPATAPARKPGLRVAPGPDGKLPDSAPFEVRKLQISGHTRFDTATLHALVAEAEGQRLTLRQLDAFVGRITAFYRQAGYPLAQALIPAQTVSEGVLRIEVIEARFGTVSVDNRSRVATPLLQDTLGALRPGEVVTQAVLERSLLLLSDLPGVDTASLLRPGEAVGSSDLVVRVEPGAGFSGRLTADSHGNRYTGNARLSADLNLYNPLGRGDVLSVFALSSGARMKDGRLSYEAPLNGQGTRLSGSVSALSYQLGDSAADLQAHGTARVGSLVLSHPLVRSEAFSLRAMAQIERTTLRDHVDSTGIRNDRHVGLATLGLSGDRTDGGAWGGVSGWSLGATRGRVGFDDAAAELADAGSAATQGRFTRWNLFALHYQPLRPGTLLVLSLSAQRANGNLDSSQRFSLGGPTRVRAYQGGSQSGDSGQRVSLELRQAVAALPGASTAAGQWQAVVFIDSGHVRISQRPWSAGPNGATLQGAGLGLNWAGPDAWNLRTSVAHPIGSTPEGIDRATHAWVELSRGF